MTEKSHESTAGFQETKNALPETMNVLPALSDNKGSLSLTLTVDKSVRKIASWVVFYMVASSALVGMALVAFIWMIFAYSNSEREARMVEYYQHEIDGKLIAAGFLKPSQNFDNFKSQHQQEK